MTEFNYNEINKRRIAPNLLKTYGIDEEVKKGDENDDYAKNPHPSIIHDTAERKAMSTSNTPGKETVEKGGPGSGKHKFTNGTVNVQGRRFKTKVFNNAKETNAFLEENKDHGVIHEEKDGRVHVTLNKDKGDQGHKEDSKEAHEKRGFDEGKGDEDVTGKYEKLNKSFEALGIDIEKAEGSRGGKVIGHTKSGKPIYDTPDHSGHQDFDVQDHTDAVEAHKKQAKEHNARSMGHATNKKEEIREKDIAASHNRKAQDHETLAKKIRREEESVSGRKLPRGNSHGTPWRD